MSGTALIVLLLAANMANDASRYSVSAAPECAVNVDIEPYRADDDIHAVDLNPWRFDADTAQIYQNHPLPGGLVLRLYPDIDTGESDSLYREETDCLRDGGDPQ